MRTSTRILINFLGLVIVAGLMAQRQFYFSQNLSSGTEVIIRAVSTPSTANASTYATAAFVPAVGDLLVVFVVASGTVTNPSTMTDSLSETSFTQIVRTTRATGDSMYAFVADALTTTAGSRTITFNCTGDAATGAIITVYRIATMTAYGTAAIVQNAVQASQTGGGTPAPVFSSAVTADDIVLATLANIDTSPTTVAPPSGFVEGSDSYYSTPSNHQATVWRRSGFAGTTLTWGGASATAFGDIALEISNGAVATPTSSVNGGAGLPQSVADCTGCLTLSSVTTGAYICYTDDGTTPAGASTGCTNGTHYTAALSAASTTTFKAIGYRLGYQPSATFSGTLTIGSSPAFAAENATCNNDSCSAGASTCQVTCSVSANQLLIVDGGGTGNAVWPVSIDAGTLVTCYSCYGEDGSIGKFSAGYVLSTTAKTNPTITFSGVTGGGQVLIRTIPYSGGSIYPDAFNSAYAGSVSSPYSGNAIGTLTGSSDALFAFSACNTAVTAVASPWNTNGFFDAGGGWAEADRIGTTSTTVPTWTGSGCTSALSHSMAFGFGATACVDQAVFDGSGGTNNAAATTTNLGSSTHGLPNGSWSSAGGTNPVTFTDASGVNLTNSVRVCGGGGTYQNAARGLHTNLATNATSIFSFNLAAQPDNVSIGFWYTNNLASSDTTQYMNGMYLQNGGSDFAGLMCHAGQCYLETNANPNGNPDVGTKYTYTGAGAGPWWVTILFQKYVSGATHHKLSIYGSDGTTLLSAQEKVAQSSSPHAVTGLLCCSGDDAGTSAHTADIGAFKLDPSGSFPLLP